VNDEKLKQRSFSSSSSQSRASISSRKNSSTLSKVATVPPRRSTVSRPAVPSKPLTKPSTKPLNNNTTATTAAANRQNENNRKNAKISKTSRGENRGIGEQPDLLKETIRKESKKEKESSIAAKKAARWNAEGFNMMAVVANYYIQRCSEYESKTESVLLQLKSVQGVDGEEVNLWKEEIDKLQEQLAHLKLSNTTLEEGSRRGLEELEARLRREADAEHSRLQENLAQTKEKEKADLTEELTAKLKADQAELTEQLTKQFNEDKEKLSYSLHEHSEQEKVQLTARLREEAEKESSKLREKLEQELTENERILREKLREEKVESDQKLREVWEKEKAEQREKERHELRDKKGKKVDYRLEAEKEKGGRLEQEVESLRTVLEMKTEELHASRLSRLRLEEKVTELEQREEAWRKASAQVEDLKEQLTARLDAERRLVEENRSLSSLMERETSEKKRLSMENETLNWRIRQDESMSFSYCEGTDVSLPIIGNLRSGLGSRPLSAPPGKHAPLGGPASLPFGGEGADYAPPDSPRVLEVVEKVESVAWKLEYDLPDSGISPRLSRKLSPQSPLFLRKCKSSSLMTRSLDRTNLLMRSNSSPNATSSPLLARSASMRRKVSPQTLNTLNEFTDESDESRKSSPDQDPALDLKQAIQVDLGGLDQPAPVDIVGYSEDALSEISSSSEIEVGEPDSLNTDSTDPDTDHHHHTSDHNPLHKAGLAPNSSGSAKNCSELDLNSSGLPINSSGMVITNSDLAINSSGLVINNSGLVINSSGLGLTSSGLTLNLEGDGCHSPVSDHPSPVTELTLRHNTDFEAEDSEISEDELKHPDPKHTSSDP